MYKVFIFAALLLCIGAKVQAQAGSSIWVSSTQQAARPGTGQLMAHPLLGALFAAYDVSNYDKAYHYSVRPEAEHEYMIRLTGNGDSLAKKLRESGLFDSVLHFGSIKTAGDCAGPWAVNDPKTFTMVNWAIENVDAACAWPITRGDPRVVLAYADTEFDSLHEDLRGKFVKVWRVDPTFTGALESHGTKMSSLALAQANNHTGISGLGYDLKGAGYEVRGTNIHKGIIQAYAEGRRVVNVSWYGTNLTYAQAQEITQHGTILVVSAGNEPDAGAHEFIADIPGVINVSSINYENKNEPTNCARNTWVDLCAPGSEVIRATRTADNPASPYSYSTPHSTSSAASFVTGTVGLMLAVNPCLSPSEAEYIIKQTCDPIADAYKFPGLLGAGHLNTYKAVKMAQETSCMNIKGIDINTLCRPGKVAGLANPQFTVLMEGVPRRTPTNGSRLAPGACLPCPTKPHSAI